MFGTSRENAQVSVRHVCKALGLDLKRQLQKLRDSKWAVVGSMPTTAADGKTYQQAVIRLDDLPTWLLKISPGRVKEQFREKLELYQLQARNVLAAAFLDAETGLPPALLQAIDEVRQATLRCEAERERVTGPTLFTGVA